MEAVGQAQGDPLGEGLERGRSPMLIIAAGVVGMLIGATWVLGGVIGIFHAISDGPDNGRGWRIASGLISLVGGAAVLIYPVSSVAALTWLLGIVVLVAGVVLVVRGVFARRSTQPVDAVATSSR